MYRFEELEPGNLAYQGVGDTSLHKKALKTPALDYFAERRGDRPKAQIGGYVAEQGIANVPLITDEDHWRRALEDGVAMIRSESYDEYAGLRGIFTSMILERSLFFPERRRVGSGIREDMNKLIFKGLGTGEVSATEYMTCHLSRLQKWPEQLINTMRHADWANIGLRLDEPGASLWEYIPGSNVSIFGDPHVEGRYHIGYTPDLMGRGWRGTTAGFQIEPDQHDAPQRFRKHDEDFEAGPFIEAYEAIAALPLFDTTQRPAMELGMSVNGVMQFFQYYKTGKRKAYQEPFDIPFLPTEDLKTDMVRGVTEPAGEAMKLFVTPHVFMPAMRGQAMYSTLDRPQRLTTQLFSRMFDFVLCDGYLSFKDNHSSSAPLFMPRLAAGMDGSREQTSSDRLKHIWQRLTAAERERFHPSNTVTYFDIHVTANGREAVISSDWEPHSVDYMELTDSPA